MRSIDPTYVSPFRGIDLPWLVATRARTRRDHPFLVWEPFDGEGETLSFGAFDDRVGRSVAVDSASILEALRKIYAATNVVSELTGK